MTTADEKDYYSIICAAISFPHISYGQEPFETFNVPRVTEGHLNKQYYIVECDNIEFFILKTVIDLALILGYQAQRPIGLPKESGVGPAVFH